jgi:hypothetical protein
VLEHPADSRAWDHFGLWKPPRDGGWVPAAPPLFDSPLWTCCVFQGHYGSPGGKPTWLLAAGMRIEQLPELRWGKCEQRLHPAVLARHGYAKARKSGMVSMIGGKDKTRLRNATPTPFRDLLLAIARTLHQP